MHPRASCAADDSPAGIAGLGRRCPWFSEHRLGLAAECWLAEHCDRGRMSLVLVREDLWIERDLRVQSCGDAGWMSARASAAQCEPSFRQTDYTGRLPPRFRSTTEKQKQQCAGSSWGISRLSHRASWSSKALAARSIQSQFGIDDRTLPSVRCGVRRRRPDRLNLQPPSNTDEGFGANAA